MAHYLSVMRRRKDKFPGVNFFVIIPPMVKSLDIAEFVPADGLDPIAFQKLNYNFKRIVEMMSDEIPAQLYNIDYRHVSRVILGMIQDTVFDWIMPVGTVIAVEDERYKPKLGQWEVATEYKDRYVLGTTGTPTSGGRTNFTITTANLPKHHHTYDKATAKDTFKVDKDSAGDSTAISSLKQTQTNTSEYGSDAPTAISLNPAFRSVIFMRRVR